MFVKKYFRQMFLILFLGTCMVWLVTAQKTPPNLTKKKNNTLAQIRKTQRMIQEIGAQKKNQLNQLQWLNQKFALQQELISSLQQEIQTLQAEIDENNARILHLQTELEMMQDEYAELIYQVVQKNTTIHRLNFLFASQNFQQLYRRIRYLKQYAIYRQKQAEIVEKKRQILLIQRQENEKIKQEKQQLLSEKLTETQNFQNLKSDKESLTQKLIKKEQRLRKEQMEQKKALAQLDQWIMNYIQKQPTQYSVSAKESNATPDKMGSSAQTFAKRRGNLIWPTEKGFVAKGFGKQEHPVLKGVITDNPGIDIQTPPRQSVRAVFSGVVSTIASIPGMSGKVMMIRHGDYFTVYARIQNIQVNLGQKVAEKQKIAEVLTDSEGVSQIQFQIWKKNIKLNPMDWLLR